MYIAVEGCAHGQLDTIYRSVLRLEEMHKMKVDLLICCGDFQSVRNEQDLKCMAVPAKYMEMCDFYRYYSGEAKAPVLTIFIGGNHEASNYLQEFPYGGWVAPNIYYMGYAGVVNYGGLRIGGISGIYKGPDYLKGHCEKSPYTGETVRSVYHVRNLEVYRLKQLSGDVDIFLSHDWPRGIYQHGNKHRLLQRKQHFKAEVENNTLGSRAAEDLLKKLQPAYWFSGHLHVKFPALVKHKSEGSETKKATKFLALDKCLPRREFLQVLEVSHNPSKDLSLEYDLEWLTILRMTNHLLSTESRVTYMPGPGSNERYDFTPTKEELEETRRIFRNNLTIPLAFTRTASVFNDSHGKPNMHTVSMPRPQLNPQTITLCDKLGIDDPVSLLLGGRRRTSPKHVEYCGWNDSDLNITLENSKASLNPDEAEMSDEYDGDIIMEIRVSPDPPKEVDDLVNEVSPIKSSSRELSSEDFISLGPVSSSPRYHKERVGLTLSSPKQALGSASSSSALETSSTSSLSENESYQASPSRNSQVKRGSETETPPTSRTPRDKVTTPETSTTTIENTPTPETTERTVSDGHKKFKRRNQALYTIEDDKLVE
ncbi:lariat debranching enzyme isoform X2 [Oratosquilla oratoria]|uniref:lariat debranching enzyme isoform X2 n=1 Tax=Oratosquilla oratoria TaxID=337810 RepID=UPI003F767F41